MSLKIRGEREITAFDKGEKWTLNDNQGGAVGISAGGKSIEQTFVGRKAGTVLGEQSNLFNLRW